MIDLSPNCSEATVRLRTDMLNEAELKALESLIEEWKTEKDDEGNTNWYDTEWWHGSVFGIKHISISGDYPYNFEEKISADLDSLPFRNKIEDEWDEF